MKFNHSLVSLVLLLVASTSARSESAEKCDYSGNQAQMNACAIQDFQLADKQLNSTYKQKMLSLSKADKTKLRTEQRAWLKEQKPKCQKAANDEAEGGSIWPLEFYSCMQTSTIARNEELKNWGK
nr:lysozyme inhibitor LprI family protein [uncultured Methylotenera sp.]